MTHQNIVAHLCLKYPPEVIHEITTEDIISAIVRRLICQRRFEANISKLLN